MLQLPHERHRVTGPPAARPDMIELTVSTGTAIWQPPQVYS